MGNLRFEVFAYALLPAVAIVAGGIFAAFKPPQASARSIIQHFAAGVLFSSIGVELLPNIVREHAPVEVILGFSTGVGAMLVLRQWTRARAKSESDSQQTASSLIATVGVDVAIDGALVGVGFAAGAESGRLLALALALEALFLGLSAAGALTKSGASRRRTISATLVLALLFVLGAGTGTTLLAGLKGPYLEVVLSFGLAALLFLVTEELLVEAHQELETPFTTATFFAGFLLFLVLGMIN
ncbi:ZIP family metal transporter [Gloeobacter kilaueensis]|uniref:Zinc/iron permease n=1 Tax=Gloeobacter kilaueensis (strain ATCC BAA-2537 / CCAP 1431/1 / ULC 316 / JS1) TaxID=1183438 RepID=U5QKY8_GLOK1|nr:zinc/iron permease [Gloeobacter kilaueensis]AGY58284.1 zinc/iron permease [Gloeobacter kilaueensis JS1]